MHIHHTSLDGCAEATGAVVVIDVIRAFTTAAVALGGGAREILPVGTVAEAFALRAQWPEALIMGEVNGLPPEGFDFGNSPSALRQHNLSGKVFIQRTSAGTQGLVRSSRAEILLAGSFLCAAATARYIQRRQPESVTLVCTGPHDEDRALAEFLEALLRGGVPESAPYLQRVRDAGRQRILDAAAHEAIPAWHRDQFLADLDDCASLDRFDFAMVVHKHVERLCLSARRVEIT